MTPSNPHNIRKLRTLLSDELPPVSDLMAPAPSADRDLALFGTQGEWMPERPRAAEPPPPIPELRFPGQPDEQSPPMRRLPPPPNVEPLRTRGEVARQDEKDRRAVSMHGGQRQVGDRDRLWASAQQSPTGTLPGEELASSSDILQQLSPKEQDAMRARFEASGHAQTMDYGDWLAEHFSDVAPEQRDDAMQRAVRQTDRVYVGKNPDLPPGTNSPLARSRRAAGKPLPEGREPSQYSPEQRQTMGRNIYSPEVPMTPFGGTFTLDADGGMLSRAPNPALLARAAGIAADQGAGSPAALAAEAQAYNIDVQQYGDDMDMLRADVEREKKRHEELSRSWDVVATPMGGFRYVSNPNKARAALADRDRNATPERKQEFARDILKRFGGRLTPQQQQEVLAYADTPDGMAKLRQFNATQSALRDAGIAGTVRNNWANRNMTIAANNPRVAPGMYMRSLQQAAESGDPMQVAAVHESFGNHRAAAQAMDLAGRQTEAQAAVDAERLKNPPADTRTVPEQLKQQYDAALALPDDAQRLDALRAVIHRANTNPPLPPEEVDRRAKDVLLQHKARTDPNSPEVKQHLDKFRGDKDAYLTEATKLGIPQQQAERMYAQAHDINFWPAVRQGFELLGNWMTGRQ